MQGRSALYKLIGPLLVPQVEAGGFFFSFSTNINKSNNITSNDCNKVNNNTSNKNTNIY